MGAGRPAQGRQVGAGVHPVPKYIISSTAFLPPGHEKHTQSSGLKKWKTWPLSLKSLSHNG